MKLQKEFRYLQHKFELSVPMTATQWRFLRLRPGNFPHVRLAQLANLYYKERSLFSRIMEADTLEAVSVGDIVDVKVMSVDLKKKRIQLTMRGIS